MLGAEASIKTYADMAWRRRWWIVIPLLIGVAVSAVVLSRMPKIYRSTATILVSSQRLPESFVQSTVTMRVQEMLASLEVRLLSESNLEPIVDRYDLYVDEKGQKRSLEKAVGALRRQIELEYNPRRFSYFRIHVDDRDPRRAAAIARDLADSFISENSRLREEQASSTHEQIARWAEEKRGELEQIEAELAAFRKAHPWELPEHFDNNVKLLAATQQNIALTTSEIQSVRDQISALRDDQKTMSLVEAIERQGDAGQSSAAERWLALQSELRALRLDFTDEHYLVQRKLREIDEFRATHPEIVAGESDDPAEPRQAEVVKSPELQRLEIQLAALERRLAKLQEDADTLQARIERIPDREAEIDRLTRDHGQISADYQELIEKRDEARRAEEMETAGQGEQFRIQGVPRVPSTPYQPIPAFVLGIGAIAGLGLGTAVGLALELIRNAYHSEEEFRRAKPNVPLLVGIQDMDREPGVRKAS